MRKEVITLGLALGLGFANSADAAVLRMDFGGGATEITVAQGSNFSIDFYVDRPGDGVTIGGLSTELDGDISLVGVSNSTGLPNWESGGQIGVLERDLDAASHHFAVAANGIPFEISGTGTIALGTLTATATSLGDFPITFAFPSPVFFLAGASSEDLLHHGTFGTSYDSYFTFGTGSPLVPAGMANPGQPAQPITIHVIPEPAALVLLGIGALLTVRRQD